jgi:integrase
MIDKLPEVTDGEWNTFNEFNRKITEEFLQQGHLSPKTLYQYKSGLRQFFKWVKEYVQDKPITELKPRDALRFQNYLISKGLSPSAIKFKRSVVSSLCGYIEIYYSDEFPLFRNIYNKNIPNVGKGFVYEKKPLTSEEYQKLINELEQREEWQMLAYVKFSYATGCRRAEALQLKKEIVNYQKVEGKNYYLTHPIRCKGRGKAGKVRKLYFDDEAMSAIKKWLEVRGEDECLYVFVSKTQDGNIKQLSETTLNRWCSDIFSKIVERRVHPHLFRETRATDLVVNEGKDIKKAQKLLGHESSQTTEIYVIRDDSDDIDDCFD